MEPWQWNRCSAQYIFPHLTHAHQSGSAAVYRISILLAKFIIRHSNIRVDLTSICMKTTCVSVNSSHTHCKLNTCTCNSCSTTDMVFVLVGTQTPRGATTQGHMMAMQHTSSSRVNRPNAHALQRNTADYNVNALPPPQMLSTNIYPVQTVPIAPPPYSPPTNQSTAGKRVMTSSLNDMSGNQNSANADADDAMEVESYRSTDSVKDTNTTGTHGALVHASRAHNMRPIPQEAPPVYSASSYEHVMASTASNDDVTDVTLRYPLSPPPGYTEWYTFMTADKQKHDTQP